MTLTRRWFIPEILNLSMIDVSHVFFFKHLPWLAGVRANANYVAANGECIIDCYFIAVYCKVLLYIMFCKFAR